MPIPKVWTAVDAFAWSIRMYSQRPAGEPCITLRFVGKVSKRQSGKRDSNLQGDEMEGFGCNLKNLSVASGFFQVLGGQIHSFPTEIEKTTSLQGLLGDS